MKTNEIHSSRFMQYVILLMLLFSCTLTINAKDYTEPFTGLKSTDVTDGSHALTLGTWQMKGMALSSSQLKFNGTPAYIISPKFDNITKISFNYRSGGSNKQVTISYSTDGTSWTQIDQFTIPSSSSSFSSYSHATNTGELTGVQFKIEATSNTNIQTFKVSDDQTTGGGGGSGTDYTDDPNYKTDGVWVPVIAFPTPVNTYYISTAGNDETGDGSIEKPWYNLAKAYEAAQPGDHIVCRGGKYHINRYATDKKLTIRMNKKATATAPIVIRCYDGEKPVMDFEQQLLDCNRDKSKVGDRGILLSGDYHIIYGLHLMHAADNAIKLEGSHNRIERCEFSYNLDTGIQLGFGHNFSDAGFGVSKNDGSHCAYNDIIDCDSHHNCDFDMNYGSDADGFACKMHNGKGNRFIRCRAWRNGDDAWDLYETDYSVLLAECWAWESGKAEDHGWVKEYLDGSASFSGNGNGIKLGGNGSGGSSAGVHYAYNCIAFGCNKSGSVKGFDCNSHKDGHVLIGCLAFDNGYDYMFESGGSTANTYFYNNVCLGKQEISVGSDNYNAITTPMSKLGWTQNLVTGISKDDYVTLDESEAILPRSLDGSFPRNFGRLKSSSKMVDKGSADYDIPAGVVFEPLRQVVADYPFLARTVTGSTRDLGPYERPEATAIRELKLPLCGRGQGERLYNIAGQRISNLQKGINIVNGKKYLLK